MPDPQTSSNFYKSGDVIGGTYEVCSILGKGGFGVVYLVLHRERNELCALKTFRDEFLADACARGAFEKEALLWVRLEEHPFILAAQYVREFSGRLFVAMDYVPPDIEGRVTLNDHLCCGKPLIQERALEWAVQFCVGMEHAINHGIKCHRDIKPANILICDGAVRISDFGLAAAAEMALHATAGTNGSTLDPAALSGLSFSAYHTDGKASCGTPGYMPPEVFRGEGADQRSDIYSFGLVLWQMATGSSVPPFVGAFRGDTQTFMRDTYRRQMLGCVPAAPGPLRTVIERCLQPDPSRRYMSFARLREVLEPIFSRLTGKVITVPSDEDQSASFWNNKGMSLAALGQRQEAIACYDKALALSPQEPKIWSNKGFLLHELGCVEESLYCYDRALALDSRLDGLWCNKAASLAALGRHDEAIACYDRALALDSRHAATWNNKGLALTSSRRYREAVACFDRAIAIDPRYAEAWNSKGAALGFLDAYNDAVSCYKRALDINPRYAEAFYNTGLAFAALGRPQEAIRFYDASLEVNPRDASVWYTKANSLDALGSADEAISCYDKALRINPQHVEAWDNKGGTLVSLQRYREAMECYNAALAIDPNDPRRWFNKAYAEDQLGNVAACIGSYRRFLEMAPTHFAEQIAYARRRVRELDRP
jgi:tetratricopeptide (TPR) repeat protein